MAMTVRELIEMLEEYDPYMEVRIAEQANYPFEYDIYGVAKYNNGDGECVYICESDQIGYLSSEVWDCIW